MGTVMPDASVSVVCLPPRAPSTPAACHHNSGKRPAGRQEAASARCTHALAAKLPHTHLADAKGIALALQTYRKPIEQCLGGGGSQSWPFAGFVGGGSRLAVPPLRSAACCCWPANSQGTRCTSRCPHTWGTEPLGRVWPCWGERGCTCVTGTRQALTVLTALNKKE